MAKTDTYISGQKAITCIGWRETPRKEIITGHEDGYITVWDNEFKQPVFVFKAHKKAVTHVYYLNAEQTLFTCSKDKKFRVW